MKERCFQIFFKSFYLTNERFDECYAQEKAPALKNAWLRDCSWFLSNKFKFVVISFYYLTNHLTNIRTKLYTFCISLWKVSTITLKQLSTKRCSNIIVLLCTVEIERVQSLMRALARTNFKSV